MKMRCSSLVSLVAVSATVARMRAFCGLRSCATIQSYLSSGCSAFAQHEAAGIDVRRADDLQALAAQFLQHGDQRPGDRAVAPDRRG